MAGAAMSKVRLLNKASHGDGFYIAASPPFECRAC